MTDLSPAQRAANLKRAFAENDIPWPTKPPRRTLYFHQAGPLVQFGGGMLYVEDLNPEVRTKWRMSRGEMLRFGWRCIVTALRG